MQSRTLLVAAGALALAVAAGVAVSRFQPAPPAPVSGSPLPDIVLVTFDTTRADHLGAYGYFRDTSPNFDALAAESVLFEQYVVPVATTLPSHTTLFTGVLPIEHGIEANAVDGKRWVPAPGLVYLAEYLAGEGYDTGAFISARPLGRGSGAERGFATYVPPDQPGPRDADATTDLAIAWVDAHPGDRPMFLWVHYFDPHSPYHAPKPYFRSYDESDPELDRWVTEHRHVGWGVPPRRIRTNVSRYDEEVRFMDAEFGRLVAALKARPRWSGTAMVVVGDHGEGLGQHGEGGHGNHWAEQLRPPLLIRLPGVEPRRVAAEVAGVDVFPTVFAHVDVPHEEKWLAQVADGHDALQETPDAVWSQTSMKKVVKFGEERAFTLTTADWKYVKWPGDRPAELFSRKDRFELADVAPGHPDEIAAFDAELEAWRARQLERRAAFGAGDLVKADADMLEELEALGYVVGGGDAPHEAPPDDTEAPAPHEE